VSTVSAAGTGDTDRRAELAAALEAVRARIGAAARASGRDPAEVALLAVTKTRPASDVATLLDLGETDFGENREQEGVAKAAEVERLRPDARPHWHVVGRVQRNKARSLVRWADTVDSVDSVRLATALDTAAGKALDAGERDDLLEVLVQVSLDGDPDRGGVPADGLAALADHVAEAEHLRLRGVMAVAPIEGDPAAAFARLADLADAVRADHPRATVLSAGMSADLEAAIDHGSTCVRVGTSLLGDR
jgi:hypothetical protein